MIVLDASVAIEIVVRSEVGRLAARHLRNQIEVEVPEHFHIEAISALRNQSLRGDLGELRIAQSFSLLRRLRVIRFPVLELSDAIWELRHQLSAYDAAYLALARRLDVPLLTVDGGLAMAARAEGRLVELAA